MNNNILDVNNEKAKKFKKVRSGRMKKGKKDKNKRGEKKNNKNSFSIGRMLLSIRPLRKWLFSRRETAEYLRMVEPRTRPEEGMTGIWEKRIGICVVLFIAAAFLWIVCYTSAPEEGYLTGGNHLRRPETEENISLVVSGETETGSWEKTMNFNLDDRQFTDEERAVLKEKVGNEAMDRLSGENTSLDHVSEKLVFIDGVVGTGVELTWTKEDRYIRDNGTLIFSQIPAEGADTDIMLEAEWKNFKESYHFSVHLDPPELSPVLVSEKRAKTEIRRSIRQQATSEEVNLPETYGYSEEEHEKNYLPVFLILGILVMCPFVWREQQKRGVANREEQMLIDHPGFINKVMLLLGAGLTLRFTIERIAGEYERELADGGEKRYVYEELCVTMQELRDGVSEVQAIESFGKRCRCMPYMRFASVITQNIRKGAEGILAILEKEASDSLIERKQSALRRGEIAGTKLLFPMIVMLGLVMGIIMVPAFMSM